MIVAVSKPKMKPAVGASSGLRALIAAKRKASEAVTEDSEEEVSAAKEKKNKVKQVIPKIVTEDKEENEKTFEGGFFSVKSPVQKPKTPCMSAVATSPKSPLTIKSPIRSPASAGITKSTGGDR